MFSLRVHENPHSSKKGLVFEILLSSYGPWDPPDCRARPNKHEKYKDPSTYMPVENHNHKCKQASKQANKNPHTKETNKTI